MPRLALNGLPAQNSLRHLPYHSGALRPELCGSWRRLQPEGSEAREDIRLGCLTPALQRFAALARPF
jgi:hypothetical protein